MITKNNIFYLATIIIFVVLKFSYTLTDNDSLIFLLKPANQLVGFLTGSESIYFSDVGYFYSDLHITIEKSCSGFNFWLLCFAMLSFLALNFFKTASQQTLVILVAFVLSYVLTIFVNSSRIFASIIVQNQVKTILPSNAFSVIHEAVGILTNLSFLVLIYYFFNSFFTHRYSNAKPT